MEIGKNRDRAAFKEAYASLNAAQKQAVDTIEGPVMVVAGPGTGKTQILTLRIANILLQTDTSPDSILALTFTESGAKAMRERLRKYIGAEAYRVPIYTFHGFAQNLISKYPDSYHRVIGGRPASDLDKIHILETILDGGEVKHLRPIGDPVYYVPHILRIIGQLKQEYITPEKLVEIIARQETELEGVEKIHTKGAHKGKVRGEYAKLEKSLVKNRELHYVYIQYEALLNDKKLYDFEDMIVETVKALSTDEEMLRDLQENYQYILADEHQDVNGSQNKILELLASFHDSPNIFAVGDEKQAIYRFQGASLENFLYFKEQFVGTKVISLTENYRSGQTILDAAHSLVEVEDGPLKELRVPLMAKAVAESSLSQREFSHQAVEDDWVSSMINKAVAQGTAKSEIAVIVRTNREVEVMSTLLRKAGLTVTASADGDILRHPITQAIQGLIDVVVGNSEVALFTVLHGAYWGIDNNDLLKVLSARSYSQSLWSMLSSQEKLAELGVVDVETLFNVTTVIEEARKREVHEAPHRVLEFLLQKSGFLDHVIAYDPFEGTRVVRRLYDEIEELVLRDGAGSLRAVSKVLATRLSYGLPLNAPYIATDTDSIQVMTAHKSKGLEFEIVFVPHLTDNGWSGATKKKYFDIPLAAHLENVSTEFIEDERRLLYVAMTRAKKFLYISSSETNADNKKLIQARLLDDMDRSLIEVCNTSKEEAIFDPVDSLNHASKAIALDANLVKNLLAERGFSATSLNNYLRSPWDYFYRNVLRIPETQALPMQFGTAVHNVLEYSSRLRTKTGSLPSDSDVKRRLEQELNKLPVSTEEYSRLLDKGLVALMAYLPHLEANLTKETKEELSLRVYLPTGIPELPELILTGKLDRIDIDENGKAVRVVDYKTGKPKSRNVIEGNTKDSDGGYKRQLVFYALLLSLYDDDRYQCREGVLSFVEPDAKGVIKEESFVVTDEEIAELKVSIIEATREIISGQFLNQTCDDSKSDYCHLVRLLK
ncbi:ATP-dependent helicase [Candidatus Nomurabacteria bacterium]|nr:ATP-dependent helicase [Candidatus Kaiserbacteria bacterium]MCB9814167.1 ATP-dependent helicase [Candidatus Nomurabacteria bacterium]